MVSLTVVTAMAWPTCPRKKVTKGVSPPMSQKKAMEHADHMANLARMHQQAHGTLQHMIRMARGDDQILKHFIMWVSSDEVHWHNFWSRFRSDGTMTWEMFEKYVHWENKWQGE